MPQTLYTRDGQPVQVPDDQVAAALSTGQFGMAGPIDLMSPDGRLFRADQADEIIQAAQHGFRIQTGEEARQRQLQREFGDRDVEAFLSGLGRGATIGLSDLFLTESGIVDPKTLAGLREANPTLSMGSEILGSFAPGVLAGKGLSLAARTLRGANIVEGATKIGFGGATAETAAGSVLRTLAKKGIPTVAEYASLGAAEGSLMGLQEGITEEALGDPGTAAEGILAHIAEGAFQGMLFGGGLGAASLGVGALGKRLERLTKNVGEGLSGGRLGERFGFGPKAAYDAVGLEGNKLSKLTKKKGIKWYRGAARDLVDPGIHPDGDPIIGGMRSQGEIRQRVAETLEDVGPRIGATMEKLDEAAAKMERTVEVLQRAPDAAPPPTEAPGITVEASEKLSPDVRASLEKPPLVGQSIQPSTQPAPGGIPEWADPAKWESVAVLKESDFPDVEYIARKMQDEAEALSDSAVNDPARRFFEEEALRLKGAKDLSFQMAQKWRTDLSSRWGDIALPGSQKDAIRTTERIIAKEIEDKAEIIFKKLGKPEALEGFLRDKQIYHHLKDIADAVGIQDTAPGLLGLLGEVGRSTAMRLGVFGQGFKASLAGGALYGTARALLGKGNLLPGQVRVALGQKVAGLRLLQEAEEKVAGRIDGAVDRLVRMATGQEARGGLVASGLTAIDRLTSETDREKSLKKFVESVRVASRTPEILADRISMNLLGVEEYAPAVAAQMAQRMVHGLQIIATMLPTSALSLQPQLNRFDDHDYTDVEDAAQAFTDPVSIIEDLGRGIPPSSAGMAILRTVYEQMWSLTSAQIAHALASSDVPVDYESALLLSSFTGQPLDWSMQPDAIARSQAFYQQPAPGQGPGGTRLAGLDQMEGANKSFQTEPSRIANGELGGR